MKRFFILTTFFLAAFSIGAQDLVSGGSNSWIFHTPDDGRKTLYIAPKTNGRWDWGKQFKLFNDGKMAIRSLETETCVIATSIAIGTSSPKGKLDVLLGGWGNIPRVLFKQNADNPSIRFYRPTGSGSSIYSWWMETDNRGINFKYGFGSSTGNESAVSKVVFKNNGYVGIGTKNPDEKLTVKGKIHAKEVKVDLNIPADYVFQKYYTGTSSLKDNYTLPTLEYVETFTKKNHHLPEVPSAKEIQKNGLHLKQMTNLLLQKIEELTLYTIEQEKKLKKQEIESKYQSKKNLNLEKRLARLESLLQKSIQK